VTVRLLACDFSGPNAGDWPADVTSWRSTVKVRSRTKAAKKRCRIVPIDSPALYSDLADTTHDAVSEAKGSVSRMRVRLALGQVLDCGRRIDNARLSVLLPAAPAADPR
jgi:hypothetical protein